MGTVLALIAVRRSWTKVFGSVHDKFRVQMAAAILGEFPIFYPNFPCDIGFRSLMWSVFRHAVIFLLSGSLIYFVNNDILNFILFFINIVYVWMVWIRYKVCSKEIKKLRGNKSDSPVLPYLEAGRKGTLAVLIYSIYLYILLVLFPLIFP